MVSRYKWTRRINSFLQGVDNACHELAVFYNHARLKISGEQGSISLLVVGLFLITLTLSMAILDVSGNFIAKQSLTQIGEAAISHAAHTIDLDRYYRSDRIFVKFTSKGPVYKVPIDCNGALRSMQSAVAVQRLRSQSITLTYWNCYQDSLEAHLESSVPLLVPIPFMSGNGSNGVQTAHIVAIVKAESLVTGE